MPVFAGFACDSEFGSAFAGASVKFFQVVVPSARFNLSFHLPVSYHNFRCL